MIKIKRKRRKPDDGLRGILRAHLSAWHWTPIESWMTGKGIPDTEFCWQGRQAWIECKATDGWVVDLDSFQIGWLSRRVRAGGRCFVALRRSNKGRDFDELWIFNGSQASALKAKGIKGNKPLLHTFGNSPAMWDWEKISEILLK